MYDAVLQLVKAVKSEAYGLKKAIVEQGAMRLERCRCAAFRSIPRFSFNGDQPRIIERGIQRQWALQRFSVYQFHHERATLHARGWRRRSDGSGSPAHAPRG